MRLTDGNMTQDGVYTYTYDAENRLVCVEPTTPATGDVKVESTYDYMGRRVRKVVTAWDASIGTGGDWEAVPESSTHFVYDGWNLIMELDGSATGLGGDGLPTYSNAAIRKYTWGLDLSGLSGNPTVSGIHGAGGIGGLLAAEQVANNVRFAYFYDGNGNVGQALNQTLGSLVAKYEYDPYGNLVNMTGGLFKGKNPFRFSTKYFDKELDLHGTNDGLYYYGYRFYNPRLGRWVTRDPIGEKGGLNLHVAMRNDPCRVVDALGLTPPEIDPPLVKAAEREAEQHGACGAVARARAARAKKLIADCTDMLENSCKKYASCPACPEAKCKTAAKKLCEGYVQRFPFTSKRSFTWCYDLADGIDASGLSNECFSAIKARNADVSHVFVGVFHVCNTSNVSDMNLDPYQLRLPWRWWLGYRYEPECTPGEICVFHDRTPHWPNPGVRKRGQPSP